MISGETNTDDVVWAQEFCNQEYWKVFEDSLHYRIEQIDWKPFIFIKIFKLGMHWVVLFRAPDLSTGKARLTYWVLATWSGAVTQAGVIATPLRSLFATSFAQKN